MRAAGNFPRLRIAESGEHSRIRVPFKLTVTRDFDWVASVMCHCLDRIECTALVVYHRVNGPGLAPPDYLRHRVSGLRLIVALRSAVIWGLCTVLSLAPAGIAHGADLWRRWRW